MSATAVGAGIYVVVASATGCGHETLDLVGPEENGVGGSGGTGGQWVGSGGAGAGDGSSSPSGGWRGTETGGWSGGGTGGWGTGPSGGQTNWDPCNYCMPSQVCLTGTCLTRCTTSEDCSEDGYGHLCNHTVGGCVECLGDGDCAGNYPPRFCSAWGKCIQCERNSDCNLPEHAGRACLQGFGMCVECTSDEWCNGFPDDRTHCDIGTRYNSFMCRACTRDEHCADHPDASWCDETEGVCVAASSE